MVRVFSWQNAPCARGSSPRPSSLTAAVCVLVPRRSPRPRQRPRPCHPSDGSAAAGPGAPAGEDRRFPIQDARPVLDAHTSDLPAELKGKTTAELESGLAGVGDAPRRGDSRAAGAGRRRLGRQSLALRDDVHDAAARDGAGNGVAQDPRRGRGTAAAAARRSRGRPGGARHERAPAVRATACSTARASIPRPRTASSRRGSTW